MICKVCGKNILEQATVWFALGDTYCSEECGLIDMAEDFDKYSEEVVVKEIV